MEFLQSSHLTDFYQLNMIQAYLECGPTETAVFEFLSESRLQPRFSRECFELESSSSR